MQNTKYQLFCFLVSAVMAISSPSAAALAATRTGSTAMTDEVQQEMRLLSNHTTKSTLNKNERWLYRKLAGQIKKVAEGELTSTEFTVNLDDRIRWTKADNQNHTFDSSTCKVFIQDNFKKKLDYGKVWKYLLADMPFDLYWHDKTQGIRVSYHSLISSDGTSLRVTSITLSLYVNAKYAKRSETEKNRYYTFITNLNRTDGRLATVKKAAAKARRIVDENAGKSDYDKLYNYMKAICAATTYNKSVADNQTANNTGEGIDPWQLIYVFDEDSNTNVVCEGYAKAFAYLCDLTKFQSPNIACYMVEGDMTGGTGTGGHMWNIVTMDDNRNYLVDVTNCDAGTVGSPDQLFLAGGSGSVNSTYIFTNSTNQKITYSYSDDTKNLYGTGPDSILTLASQKYTKKDGVDAVTSAEASVKPAKSSVKIKTGKSMKVTLAGSFHQENAKSISYSTTDKKIVKVSGNGTVKALKKGTAWVKIKVVLKNGRTKTVKVKVTVN